MSSPKSRTAGYDGICAVGMTHAAEEVAVGLDELTAIRCMALCRKTSFLLAPEVQETFRQLRRVLRDYARLQRIEAALRLEAQ